MTGQLFDSSVSQKKKTIRCILDTHFIAEAGTMVKLACLWEVPGRDTDYSDTYFVLFLGLSRQKPG
jgi:hypothetical protein